MNMKKGFTLIEIMIVVAIIAILAAIAIPNFISYRRTAQENACKSNISTIENAVQAYLIKNATATEVDIATLVSQGLLKESLKCPVKGGDYTITITDDGTKDAKVEVTCEHGAASSST